MGRRWQPWRRGWSRRPWRCNPTFTPHSLAFVAPVSRSCLAKAFTCKVTGIKIRLVIIGVATLLLLKIAAAIEWLAQPGKGSAVNGPETGFTEMTAGVKIGTGHNAYALPFSGSTIKCKVSPRTSSSLGLHDALVVYMRATNGELYPQHQLTES